jgi:hypothetical protein
MMLSHDAPPPFFFPVIMMIIEHHHAFGLIWMTHVDVRMQM